MRLSLTMMSQPTDPPDIDDLWNYNEPAASEGRFRSRLAQTEPGSAAYLDRLAVTLDHLRVTTGC